MTNNTPLTLQQVGAHQLPSGVVQSYDNSSGLSPQGLITCRHRVELAPLSSCLLKLNIIADNMNGSITSGPEVCQNAGAAYPVYCALPSVFNQINTTRTSSNSIAQLSIDNSSIALVQGALYTATITNLSKVTTANNISADFSQSDLKGEVEVDNTACLSVAPGNSCALSFISYLNQNVSDTSFSIQGANTRKITPSASLTTTSPSATYLTLFDDILIAADIWDEEPKIMSAKLNFEGIEGVLGNEQAVRRAGGAWNIVTTPGASLSAYTSATSPSDIAISFGYPTYFADAFPICFSWPVLPSTVDRTDFELLLNTGEVKQPEVVSLMPNQYYNQRNCIVMFGKFANRIPPGEEGSIYPTSIRIVDNGNALTLVGVNKQLVSAVGMSKASGNPYVPNAGPKLNAAKLTVDSSDGQYGPTAFNTFVPNGGTALYGSDAQYRIRLFTTEGFSTDGVASFYPTDYSAYFRVKVVADDKITYLYNDNVEYNIPGYGTIEVVGLANLGKAGTPINDAYTSRPNNYVDIILKGDEAAMRKITAVETPASGINPVTNQSYLPIWNSGGPGNNPTPGIFYTQPGPAQITPVTVALDDPLQVNYP